MIEFPADSREFRGGFATVSQGFLVCPPRAEGAAKGIENSTDKHPSSRAGSLHSESDRQNYRADQRGRDRGEEERKAGGHNDPSKWEASEDNNAEQELDNQPSILRVGHQRTSPEDPINEGPASGDRNHWNRDIETPDDNPRKDEGTGSRIVSVNSHQKQEEAGDSPESTKEKQNAVAQTSKPKVGDGWGSELREQNPLTGSWPNRL